MAELKPCPFCGKRVARFTGLSLNAGSGYLHVWCDTGQGGCGGSGPSRRYGRGREHKDVDEARAAAIRAWNVRATMPKEATP